MQRDRFRVVGPVMVSGIIAAAILFGPGRHAQAEAKTSPIKYSAFDLARGKIPVTLLVRGELVSSSSVSMVEATLDCAAKEVELDSSGKTSSWLAVTNDNRTADGSSSCPLFSAREPGTIKVHAMTLLRDKPSAREIPVDFDRGFQVIRLRMMGFGAVALAACSAPSTGSDASACAEASSTTTAVVVPAVDPVTADLTVYGSVQAPPGVAVLNVFLSAMAESSFNVPGPLPPPTIAATSDAGEFATWHAALPYAVMVAPLDALPGKIVIVAIPRLDCPIDPSMNQRTIGVSHPLTINPKPAAVDAGIHRARAPSPTPPRA